MNIRRTTLVITQRCTLKCKLCLAFMPYYKNPVHTSLAQAERIIDNYFCLVGRVNIFSITGGEPLMNPELVPILKKTLEYRNQIESSLDMVTNGTIMFKEELLELLQANKDFMRVIISDYGKGLSVRIDDIEAELKKRGINYRIQHYDTRSDSWTYDGWVDFSDHSLKHNTEEKLIAQGKRCIFRLGHYWVINDGELHPCSRQYWRMREGILERDPDWYIDLNQEQMVLKAEQEKLAALESVPYLKSCAYCNGVHAGVKRYRPAEQL